MFEGRKNFRQQPRLRPAKHSLISRLITAVEKQVFQFVVAVEVAKNTDA